MARTLVIPDIHNAIERAEAIIRAYGQQCDRIVFLGDYFDDFHDTPAVAERVAQWLYESTRDPKRIHLLGNHDLPYLLPESAIEHYWCSGWSEAKDRVIRSILHDVSLEQFRVAVEIDGWLLSHAGYQELFLNGRSTAQVVAESACAFERATHGQREIVFEAGRARGGEADKGGVTWLDWWREFQPVDGFHQIVGHSPAYYARTVCRLAGVNQSWDVSRRGRLQLDIPGREQCTSMNWCLDTKLSCAALIEGAAISLIWL
jgi:hypothetical protein